MCGADIVLIMSIIALIGKKVGMSAFFKEDGSVVPVTAIFVGKNVLLGVKTVESDGYESLIIGSGNIAKKKRVNKPQLKIFEKANLEPRALVKEFRLAKSSFGEGVNIGAEFPVNNSMTGLFVDVSGITKGKGFQGGMKRWGFAGLRASHGVSVSHRSVGSTGNRTEPGRVFKGKKMPGHMGVAARTVQNLVVLSVDEANGLIFVNGSIPGAAGSYVSVVNSVKKLPKNPKLLNCFGAESDLGKNADSSSAEA